MLVVQLAFLALRVCWLGSGFHWLACKLHLGNHCFVIDVVCAAFAGFASLCPLLFVHSRVDEGVVGFVERALVGAGLLLVVYQECVCYAV